MPGLSDVYFDRSFPDEVQSSFVTSPLFGDSTTCEEQFAKPYIGGSFPHEVQSNFVAPSRFSGPATYEEQSAHPYVVLFSGPYIVTD